MSPADDDAAEIYEHNSRMTSRRSSALERASREAPEVVQSYLSQRAAGMPKYLAGAAAGMSPAEVDEMLSAPEVAELDARALDLMVDSVEYELFRSAMKGRQRAMEMVLSAHRPDLYGQSDQSGRSGATIIGEINLAVGQQLVEALRASTQEERLQAIEGSQQAAIEASSRPIDR